MKVIVIRSRPNDGQDGIEALIGQVFEAKVDEQGTASVQSAEFGGTITLNSSEWRHHHEQEAS